MLTNMKLGHTGFVLFITGIVLSTRKKTQSTQIMHSGSEIQLNDKIICLRGIDQNIGPTYRSICANILVKFLPTMKAPGSAQMSIPLTTVMFPEKRMYLNEGTSILTNTKISIQTNFVSDLYILIGTSGNESGCFLTVIELPFVFCIWFGFVLGAYAGLISLRKQINPEKLNWL
jgi:cytochrome c biogenesis factor